MKYGEKVVVKGHYEEKEVSPEELVNIIENGYDTFGRHFCFMFDGNPYNKAYIVEDMYDDGIDMVIFSAKINGACRNMLNKFWYDKEKDCVVEKRCKAIRKDSIVGYDVVDVYDEHGWFQNSFINVVVKD